ncbi:MAG: phosphoribosylformylglycinamidine cyclo-ligase [Pseudomonadales bacterium]|nr:phosphoribosylformylglycinamidine cyclo-ligase [Pseudomonadales bacterium]MCP5182417.1 phosphoribosylformylglycinamidine cyclo-ligase [Pseudomonadales bacterium]
MTDNKSLTYKDAGVDTHAGAALVERIKGAARATARPEMLGGLGGFAAMAEIPAGYRRPVIVTGTDGVGTKLKLAFEYDRHDTVGQDLVAMCVNDILVTGAEPFLFLDYYATGALDVDTAARVITGIARACELAGCTLAGGETAEMPGFYARGEYDLAGFGIGIVEYDAIIDGKRIDTGDVLIGLPSSGPHSNGFSLIRRIIERQGMALPPQLLDQLLAPTRIYVKSVRATLVRHVVHGMVHITGGGFFENVPRMFTREGFAARIDITAWNWPSVFAWLQQAGNVAEKEMLSTFNCGIGFILCVPHTDAEGVMACLRNNGEQPIRIGDIVPAGTIARAHEIVVD